MRMSEAPMIHFANLFDDSTYLAHWHTDAFVTRAREPVLNSLTQLKGVDPTYYIIASLAMHPSGTLSTPQAMAVDTALVNTVTSTCQHV